MFSTELANNITTVDAGGRIPAGIHEDVVISNVKMETSPNGNSFIAFTFEKNGATVTQTEWEPKKWPDMTDERFQETCTKQVKHILQILECYYPKESLVFSGETYKEFATWVKTLMDKADLSKKLRVKFVYKNNGYVELPKYCMYKFIEPMTISKEDSKIKELSIDNFTKPVVADKETVVTNPFDTTSNNGSDLPF